MTERALIAEFLLGQGGPPSVNLIRRHGLGAWTYTALPPAHPLRKDLRADYLVLLERHLAIKRELIPLMHAWSAAGIDILPFKGFWLSETVYRVPGARFYGDVDLLLRDSQMEMARRISQRLGWIAPHSRGPQYSHGAFNLTRPKGRTCIDAHRFVLHSRDQWNSAQRRITEAVWQNSRRRMWQGIRLCEMQPVDAVLILMLQRCWGDGWQLKPADPIDLRLITNVYAVSRDAVLQRAHELDCVRTVRIFLELCDPWQRTLQFEQRTTRQIRRFRIRVLRERPLLAFERLVPRLRRAPALLLDISRVMPSVIHAFVTIRRERSLFRILDLLTPRSHKSRSSVQDRMHAVRAVRWACKLMPGRSDSCLLRSLAIYSVLRRQAWPVTFVSGVGKTADDVVGHAWIELNGEVLPELLASHLHLYYTPSFRYPRDAEPSERQRSSSDDEPRDVKFPK